MGMRKFSFNMYKEKQPNEEYSLLGLQQLRAASHDFEEDLDLAYHFSLITREQAPNISEIDLEDMILGSFYEDELEVFS